MLSEWSRQDIGIFICASTSANRSQGWVTEGIESLVAATLEVRGAYALSGGAEEHRCAAEGCCFDNCLYLIDIAREFAILDHAVEEASIA